MADERGTHTHILRVRAASIALTVGIALLTLLAARSAQAQIFTTLFTFDGTDGSNPSGLIQATDGNLYGTTPTGGANESCVNGYACGTVFKITPSGALNTFYNFCSQSGCADGSNPEAALVQATDGNFYGTTYNGGANESCNEGWGCGTVFRITPSGSLTTLYSFCSQSGCTDGENPYAPLVQATDGNFYGTAFVGGAYGYGTIFKITPSGTLTTLYSFCPQRPCTDGNYPTTGLVQGTDGNLYGTTGGTVFKISTTGVFKTLYTFCSQPGCTDGDYSDAGLVEATDGNFYGTTGEGGAYESCGDGEGCGTVFEITPTGTLTTLHSFDGTDGNAPLAGLLQATDGDFYGTTAGGGDKSNFCYAGLEGCGTIFKVTSGGTLTTIQRFNGLNGSNPRAALVQDTNGTFYGTAVGYDRNEYGTIFGLSVGLGPFVETQPAFGPVGIPVEILGTDLTGATSVTFNGIPAVFNVLSPSLIGARVPAGATTGTVQVVTPGGTLSSNVPFRVRQ